MTTIAMSKLTVSIKKGAAASGFHIPLDVANAMAVGLDEGYVIIPRSDLPEVTRSQHDENTYYAERENIVYTSPENARMWVMRDVAVWQFIESEAGIYAARREELARELSPLLSVTFGELSPAAKNAIDRIIELEGKSK